MTPSSVTRFITIPPNPPSYQDPLGYRVWP